jgi:hypothetical protein
MSQHVLVEIEMPAELEKFTLPEGVDQRLQELLDRQDRGETLTPAERKEAEGLVNLAELLSLLRLRAQKGASLIDAKLQSVQEFESRVKALSDKIRVKILDPYEEEDAVAKIYLSERELNDTIQDIAIDIQDRTGVWIVPMIIYERSDAKGEGADER